MTEYAHKLLRVVLKGAECLFSFLRGGNTCALFVNAGEIRCVDKADLRGNFRYGAIGGAQQILRFFDANVFQVLHGRNAELFFERKR